MTPAEYLAISKQQVEIIVQAKDVIRVARESAKDCPFPEHVRPSTPADIVVDQILWYRYKDRHWWTIVSEVLCPVLSFKAYVGEDGCRYGLADAFVEVAWGPSDYVAVGPNCMVVASGKTEQEAKARATAAGYLGASVVHASCINEHLKDGST